MPSDPRIGALSADSPSPHPLDIGARWMLTAFVYGTVILIFVGLRSDISVQLERSFFVTETALLLAIAALSLLSAAWLCSPGHRPKRALVYLPMGLAVVLAGFLFHALPTKAPATTSPDSMECLAFIVAYSVLPAMWLITGMRRLHASRTPLAGAMLMLAASSIGVLIQRLSEENDTLWHLLQWHYAPMIGALVLGMILGPRLLRS